MLENGYIKLYRSLLSWEWYGDANTLRVFLHLLLTANHEPGRWKGIEVQRGQRVSSFAKIGQELGLSEKEVRTAVRHLIKTGEMAHSATSKYGLFTVKNYDRFQMRSPTEAPCGEVEGHPAGGQPGTHRGTQRATKEEGKEKKKKEEEIPPKSPQGDQAESLAVEMAAGTAKAADHSMTPGLFEEFWGVYPKKVGKGAARKAWEKIRPSEDLVRKIISAVERYQETAQWQRDGGQYIPNPATWLNQERWEDEPETGRRNASYDIDELEEMSRFDLPDEL